tara:strand:- start:21 stop:467 length:447 start_codon:yes stop_codon:yes gene_type:complete
MVLTDEQKKANKKASSKKWRDKNKGEIKVWGQKYYNNHIAERKEYNQTEKKKENDKKRGRTPKAKKYKRIFTWKNYGVICDDWDKLYEKYINTKNCELCNIELTEGKNTNTRRSLDHNHYTGLVRNILCSNCNSKLPRQKNKDLISLQ